MPRFRSAILAFFAVTLTGALLVSLGGCGDKPTRAQGQAEWRDTFTTGGTTDISTGAGNKLTHYTIAGFPELFAALANDMGEYVDPYLSYSIEDVQVIPMDHNNAITDGSPYRLQVQIALRHMYYGAAQDLVFNSPLAQAGNHKEAKNIRQEEFDKYDQPYWADFKCYDNKCEILEIRLRRHQKLEDESDGDVLAQAGILYTWSRAYIEITPTTARPEISNTKLRELQEAAKESFAVKQTVVIVNGPSFTRISLPRIVRNDDPSNEQSNEMTPSEDPTTRDHPATGTSSTAAQSRNRPFLVFETDLVDTAAAPSTVKYVRFDDETKASAKLFGNDAETGSIIVDLSIPGASDEEEESVQVLILPEPPEVKIEVQAPNIPTPQIETTITAPTQRIPTPRVAPRQNITLNKGLFRTSAQNDNGLKEAETFAGYSQHPLVEDWVSTYIRSRKSMLSNLFTYAPAVVPYISRVFDAVGLTPEFAYILVLESDYLISGEYDAVQVTRAAVNGSAFGPWQIINSTASGIRRLSNVPFNVFEVRNRNWDPRDDRGFLVQSTYMAAWFLKHLSEKFEQDAALIPVAYTLGEPSANSAFERTAQEAKKDNGITRLTKYQVTFDMVAKYRMAPQDQIDYGLKFLALREIGQNPERYGFDKITPVQTEKHRERLLRPGGPLPPGFQN